MSKPVTNVEIEDVLSSIRRLVSSSDRAERPEEIKAEKDVDRLVLTPSLRVGGHTDSDEENISEQDVAESTSSEEGHLEAADDVSDTITDEAASDDEFLELIAKSSGADADEAQHAEDADHEADESARSEMETSADDDLDNAENDENSSRFESEILSEEDLSAEFAAAEDEDRAESRDADLDAELTAGVLDLKNRAAEFETVVAERDDAWDPDGTTEDENAGTRVGPLPWSVDDDGAEDTATAPDDEVDMALAAAVFRRSRASDVTDPGGDTAEPEPEETVREAEPDADAAAEATPSDVEEDGIDLADIDLDQVMADLADKTEEAVTEATLEAVKADDALMTNEPAAFAFQDRGLDEPVANDTGSAKKGSASETSAPLAIEEALLDEDALRDMVSDIVRQELQGALGERITRNVRKLVRREIHRALASQELE